MKASNLAEMFVLGKKHVHKKKCSEMFILRKKLVPPENPHMTHDDDIKMGENNYIEHFQLFI